MFDLKLLLSFFRGSLRKTLQMAKKLVKMIGAAGFLLRFEVAGTNVSIAGTKDGSRATIFARSAKSG